MLIKIAIKPQILAPLMYNNYFSWPFSLVIKQQNYILQFETNLMYNCCLTCGASKTLPFLELILRQRTFDVLIIQAQAFSIKQKVLQLVLYNLHTKKEKVTKKVVEEKKEAEKQEDDEYVCEDEETSIRLKTPRGTRDYNPHEQGLRNEMMAIIKRNFDNSGGQYLETPVIELRDILMNKYGEDEKLIYELQLQDGAEELCLRYDLTVPLSRYVAMNRKKIKSPFKAARMGRVYRRDQPRMTKGRLREFWQCDYDIVRTAMPSHMRDLVFDDMEVIALICQTLMDLGVEDFVIKLNNRKILDVICGVKNEQVRAISSAIDKLDKREWNQVKEEMIEKGITAECAETIYAFVQIKGKPHEVLEQLKKNKDLQAYNKIPGIVSAAIEEFELLMELLQAYHGNIYLDKVCIDMSMVRGLDYYTGIILEAVFTDPRLAEDIGSISAGGRYDKLIQGFVPSQEFPCVGASIGFERIFSYLLEKHPGRSSTSTDILVCEVSGKNESVKDILYIERLKLLEELKLRNGFSCEIMNKFKPSFRDQINYAEDREIKWLVIIGEEELANNTVNLRRLTLVGDRVIIKSKDKKTNGQKGVIIAVEQPEDNDKAFFFYIKPDDPALQKISQSKDKPNGWKLTKKEIGQVIEQNKEETISELQITGLKRSELIAFLKARLPNSLTQ
ncbi:hypothetical protein RFI_00293 [Reticulomyxa filosa]|uniref:histidine--tRNA ligase n=1 Tax=Reticulomyxa filosa TaxID=46433 RepID=X6PF83_RETFI|nr:hypothetical protein RFI_00293 [Reticulomyxa filosa]|eukprot:ETO36768.1 hypothetical protein RFI_00293 [Reticulomyxa filosa]